ncbi:MAG: fluoride efflux transporter CrcB [Actinomycetota bacterium]
MVALAVVLGGGLGALARYWLEGLIAPRQGTPFPLSTLVVNVSGSILFGALAGMATKGDVSRSVLLWAGVGWLGGYTTFSTFTYETVKLIEDGAWRYAAWNLVLSGPLSFAGAGVAYLLARWA